MPGSPAERESSHRNFDAASGLPLTQSTREALAHAWVVAGADPSRRYQRADTARRVLEHSRAGVATALACRPTEVAFLPGDADLAMAQALRASVHRRARVPDAGAVTVAVTATEEVGTLRALDQLRASPPAGVDVSVRTLPVDRHGLVDPNALSGEVTALVACVQQANGEIGTVQPLDTIRRALPSGSILVTDARHTVGRTTRSAPADTSANPSWDILVADPRNWGGPGGYAVMAVRGGARLPGAFVPTDGPLGVEPPHVDVPLIAAGALSLEQSTAALGNVEPRLRALTQRLTARLAAVPDTQVLGHPHERLAHIAMFSFLYVAADELVDELDRLGWAVASGSSCTADTERPLHVLEAIGALTHGNLRLSLTPSATSADVDALATDIATTVERLRREAGVDGL